MENETIKQGGLHTGAEKLGGPRYVGTGMSIFGADGMVWEYIF